MPAQNRKLGNINWKSVSKVKENLQIFLGIYNFLGTLQGMFPSFQGSQGKFQHTVVTVSNSKQEHLTINFTLV